MATQAISFPLLTVDATHKLGIALGRSLPAGTVILLEGTLGSGKTTLVQGMGKGLGISDSIVSPTFTLINEYSDGRIPLYHLDLYRLSPNEVGSLYPELYWDGQEYPSGITAIEWADRLPYRPDNYLKICLSYIDAQASEQPVKGGSGDRRLAHLESVGQIPIDLRPILQIKNLESGVNP
ncbi:MAG: tRNA (adenosine(37)-N6)-threonylcarbamoyltransferase complex ATPase subunit type 1 TsaE [Elainellaceae cyanobacterium]